MAALLGVALLLAAMPGVVELLRHWDLSCSSERQLRLERRTYLLSTLVGFVFATQVVALLLFVFNADRMSSLFVGAMCAVGTLKVNGFGFPALFAQIVIFFAASSWLVINRVDNLACDYPLVKIKYGLLLALLPLLMLSAALQLGHFLDLRANVITSCCGSLFSEDAGGLFGDVAALPPQPTMIVFYATLAIAVGAALAYCRSGGDLVSRRGGGDLVSRRYGGYLVALCSVAAFVVAIAAIVSFVSLYIYEHPNHHCPFCVLKPEYHFQGYWLYLPLFIGSAAGLGVGAIEPFARFPSLTLIVPALGRRLARLAAAMYIVLAIVATLMIVSSRLVLIE